MDIVTPDRHAISYGALLDLQLHYLLSQLTLCSQTAVTHTNNCLTVQNAMKPRIMAPILTKTFTLASRWSMTLSLSYERDCIDWNVNKLSQGVQNGAQLVQTVCKEVEAPKNCMTRHFQSGKSGRSSTLSLIVVKWSNCWLASRFELPCSWYIASERHSTNSLRTLLTAQ